MRTTSSESQSQDNEGKMSNAAVTDSGSGGMSGLSLGGLGGMGGPSTSSGSGIGTNNTLGSFATTPAISQMPSTSSGSGSGELNFKLRETCD